MAEGQDFTERHIETVIWYVAHKTLLKRLLIGAIMLVDVALILFSLFGAGLDFASLPTRRQQDLELLKTQIPWSTIRAESAPIELELGGVELLRVGGVVDVLARVRNPNPRWYARFHYTIGLGDNVESNTDGFLLPGEERTLFRSIRAAGGTVVFTIENVTWRRINPKEISNFETWRAERINFETKDAQFIPAVISENNKTVSRAKFTITNKSAYSYLEPAFLVLLYRGSRLLAIQKTVLEQFVSGQTRQVEVSWFDQVGAISNIEIVPDIDVMDEEVYLKPGD